MAERIKSIEYIRGIGMLGVIGIHTGAYSLSNPDVNIHIFALLEIVSRFTVPIFFFVSAFGLFMGYPLDAPFRFGSFLSRRLRTVVIPYLVWSFLYMALFTYRSTQPVEWELPTIGNYLFFGWGSYQLYFLVILFWFYVFMPLWRAVLPFLLRHPGRNFTLLLILQIAFNYYSSYGVMPEPQDEFLRLMVQFRMSYLPLHYIFIFLLGGAAAVRWQEFKPWLDKHAKTLSVCFWLSMGSMLTAYYTLLFYFDYNAVSTVNTIHQLSPIGVLYTLAASLHLTRRLEQPLHPRLESLMALLSRHSYSIYLVHPWFMYYMVDYITENAIIMTVPVILLFYCTAVILSIGFGILLQKTAPYAPFLSTLLTGAAPKKLVPGSSAPPA